MPKKLLGFICPSVSWGGLEMNVLRLACWLKKRGWEIILYGYEGSLLYRKAQENNIKVRDVPSRSKFADIFLAVKLARLIKRDKVNVVLLHLNRNILLTVLGKMFSRNFFKLIYVQHMHVGGKKKDFFHSWEYSHLDIWVTPLPTFVPILLEKINIDPQKIKVIPFGIDMEKFTSEKPDRMQARSLLKLPADVFIAGVIGRLDFKKGQHILIEACTKVHQAGYPLHLLIVGEESLNEQTHYAKYLHQLTEQLNLKEFVHFLPYQKEIETAYKALDLFVLTSQSETYGMVTIEAMACGLPIIATNAGGTKGIIKNDVNGFLVTPFEIDDLANTIIKVISDQKLRYRLAVQAKKDALEKYSHIRQCEMLEELLERLE